jgi:hypothetical protein
MNTRRLLLLVLVVTTAAFLDAQTRRIGSTREDQTPAPSSSTRGEQRGAETTPPPTRPVNPVPTNPPPPQRPVGPVHPTPAPPPSPVWPAPPPADPPPGGGVLFDAEPVSVVVEASLYSVSIPREVASRWPIVGTELVDRLTDAQNSGYNFEDGEVVPFNDSDADLYCEGNLLRAADDCDIQDLGPAKGIREDLRVKKDGWATRRAVEVESGHQYAVWRWNGDCVRIFVQEVLDDGVVFDWMPRLPIERTKLDGPLFGR